MAVSFCECDVELGTVLVAVVITGDDDAAAVAGTLISHFGHRISLLSGA